MPRLIVWLGFVLSGEGPLQNSMTPTESPEVLDPHRLVDWLLGSIWALLALNGLALVVFILSLLAPKLKILRGGLASVSNNAFEVLKGWNQNRAEALALKREELNSAKAAQKPEAQKQSAPTAHDSSLPLPPEELPIQAEITKVKETEDIPPPPPPPPPPANPSSEAASPLPAPEPVADSAPPPIPEPEPAKAFQATTEVYETSEEPKVEVPPASDDADKAMAETAAEAKTPASVSLQENSESGETKSESGASAKDFEKLLDDALAENPELTEEIPVFDPESIDQALTETLMRDEKGSS